jgi:hypothetical protein
MRIASFRASTFFRPWTRFAHSRTGRCLARLVIAVSIDLEAPYKPQTPFWW